MQSALPKVFNKAPETETTSHSNTPINEHGTYRDSDGSISHGHGYSGGADAERDETRAESDAMDKEEDGDSHRRFLSKEDELDNGTSMLLLDDVSDAMLKSAVKASRVPIARSPISKLPNEILTHALSHLPAHDLSSAALVSKRLHALITTPHAWRAAFSRYFPGATTIAPTSRVGLGKGEVFRSDKRAFNRLTALATWRSEYILRTSLLRSLSRGKPQQGGATITPRGFSGSGSAVMMYHSQLFTPVTHLDATFGSGLMKNYPRFIHGSDEFGHVTSSEPTTGKIDSWGFSDPQSFRSFVELYTGDEMYGLGAGNIVGLRNVMDVSQPFGMVYGEGFPDGGAYYRSVDEPRGRFLLAPIGLSDPELGIPSINRQNEAISATWIAKTAAVPGLTEGLVGIMTGSSLGVVSAYSLGSQDLRDLRLSRGELTARWVLSPGVPIIAIVVDESYSLKRQAQNRIWAVALNALGELFIITKFPKRQPLSRGLKLDGPATERMAWMTGRSVYWSLVESSRRIARPDPYGESDVDGSYSPQSSWLGMCLSVEQVKSECREIELYLHKLPKEFRKLCNGWDMRRKLEVDFAGDDGNFAGESLIVFECGLEEDGMASVKRFSRLRVPENEGTLTTESSPPTPDADKTPMLERGSIFGSALATSQHGAPLEGFATRGRGYSSMSYSSVDASPERSPTVEEWRCSQFTFNGSKGIRISTTGMDCSTYATLTLSEDPAVGMLGSSETSSTIGSPYADDRPITPSDVPGQRSRYIAAGTTTGNVYVWDCRAAFSTSTDIINSIDPVRVIYTDSPEISSVALTALQIVVGGNDGLVQSWDPLASSPEPIRTLNSRFSSRARRRLVQAQASPAGIGINGYAAGAICLDPDPSILRGVVSLGTHLRYWSYSSHSADQYKGSKRRLRRSERGSNNHGGDYSAVRSSNLKNYIATERLELEQENARRRMHNQRLKNKFGMGLMDNEEQALAYAALLSEESLVADEQRRTSETNTPTLSSGRFAAPTIPDEDEDVDPEIAEAIRLSLEGDSARYSPPFSPSPLYDVPIRVSRKGRRSPKSASRSPPLKHVAEASNSQEMDDFEFALQLSLAEEQSRREAGTGDDFPSLSSTGKGKGRAND